MDEKLKLAICKTACPIGYPRCSQGTSCLIPVRLEQAFRDAKWIEPQQPDKSLEQGIPMDEKIDKLLGGCPGYPLDLSAAEQQVWLDAQRAMLEVGYRKPQQPGEKRGKVKGESDG
jgi:hypothetical protein